MIMVRKTHGFDIGGTQFMVYCRQIDNWFVSELSEDTEKRVQINNRNIGESELSSFDDEIAMFFL